MNKTVLLIGGKSKTKVLAMSLLKKGYKVTAINESYEDCLKLAEIKNLTVINGDGTRPYVLKDASAEQAQIAIALTSLDEDNLVICELCKKRFHVKKTVALVSDPMKTDFFIMMGIDSVVCAISAVTSIIEQQAFVEEMANIVNLGEGRIQISEVPISGTSPVAGMKLWEISLPTGVIIGCILRGDKTMVPRGDSRILAGDMLILISDNGQEMKAIQTLTGR